MSKRETMLAVTLERAAISSYLRAWAAKMRRELEEAGRDENGKASLFSNVGLAEAQGLDLESGAIVLEAAAEKIDAGAHYPKEPPATPGRGRGRD